MPITKIWNLFIKLSHFPKDCKVAKFKPLYKNDTKTDPKDFPSSGSLQNYRKSDARSNYELFNKQQQQGCEVAKFKSLYKKGTKIDPKNFRPISFLPIVSKIVEKVINDQTMNYLTENNILYRYQSGFRKNHSTDTALAYLMDKTQTGFDSGLLMGMILIDLQKAFDTTNHDILLEKCLLLDFLIVQ